MSDPRYLTILAEPSAFWAANSSEQKIPEIARCSGVVLSGDRSKMTIYVSQRLGGNFLKNLRRGCIISVSATCVPTFESYQYKGPFERVRPATPDEETAQREYLQAFTEVTGTFGFDAEALFRSYFHLPSFAVIFSIADIFDQTPKKGTGTIVTSKEK